jgi:heme exporter protein C
LPDRAITGPLWGRKVGCLVVVGRARTSALVLWLVRVLPALRRFGGPGSERLSAAIGLFGMFNTPFVYWSVNLWRTLHPKTSVVPTLPVAMGLPLWFSTAAFLGLFTLLLTMTRLERRRAEPIRCIWRSTTRKPSPSRKPSRRCRSSRSSRRQFLKDPI